MHPVTGQINKYIKIDVIFKLINSLFMYILNKCQWRCNKGSQYCLNVISFKKTVLVSKYCCHKPLSFVLFIKSQNNTHIKIILTGDTVRSILLAIFCFLKYLIHNICYNSWDKTVIETRKSFFKYCKTIICW